VQVVIDPGRSYSASGPGTNGTIKLEVEYSIAGGPLVVRDGTHLIHVLVTYTGDPLPLLDKDADNTGKLEAPDVRWPDNVDPVRFDIHATMVQIIDGATVPTKLARFDRLTKATGARLVYSVLGTNEAHIVVVDKHGATTIADHADQPQWSPDGSRIAYYSQSSGQIFTMAPDGTDKQQLTSGADHAVDPAWSPDGTQIAYLLSPVVAGGKPTIAIAEADGSSTRNTGVQAVPAKLSWSPDGARIAFVNINPDALAAGRASLTLYVMDVAGGGSARLIRDDCGGGAFWPDWSPTGSTIAFQCADAESAGHLWVATVSGSGGGVRRLAMIDSERPIVPAWSPDGKTLATGGFETGLRFIAVDPSGATPTVASGGDVPFWVDWAP
jgi:Tol biopolymer transport system component